MLKIILLLLASFVTLPALAALQVELVDRNGQITTLTFQNGWMRGVSPRSDYIYTLMNLKMQRIYLIDMGDKTNTDVTPVFMNGTPHEFGLVALGSGSRVAGRDTKEYLITNDEGVHCAHIFLWEHELEGELVDLQNLLKRIKIDPESLLPVLGPLADGVIPKCVRAEMDALGPLSQKGLIAMRVNQKGITTLRIQGIKTIEQDIPVCMMNLPKHYQPETPPSLAMELIVRRLTGGRNKPATPLTNECP